MYLPIFLHSFLSAQFLEPFPSPLPPTPPPSLLTFFPITRIPFSTKLIRIITFQKNLQFFIFSNTSWSMLYHFSLLFRLHFPHNFKWALELATMNLQHYRVFSCTPFMPTFHVHSQYEILFHFSLTLRLNLSRRSCKAEMITSQPVCLHEVAKFTMSISILFDSFAPMCKMALYGFSSIVGLM